MRTRAKKSTASSKQDDTASKPTSKTLDASLTTPPHVFILPDGLCEKARVVTAPSPTTSNASRYLVCPSRGFYEFIRIAAPKRHSRSWLLTPERKRRRHEAEKQFHEGNEEDSGYVLQTPDSFVATPVDPLFLLLPALVGDSGNAQEFLAASDYIAKLCDEAPHLQNILRQGRLEGMLESRIEAVCDCMDMGDDKMYALSLPKLAKQLVGKARRMGSKGLPKSMEERFIRQALEVPVTSIKREGSSVSIVPEDATTGAESQTSVDTTATSQDTQDTNVSGTTAASISTAATRISTFSQPAPTSDEIIGLLRLRTALNFLLTSYIPPSLRRKVEPLTSDTTLTSISWAPLNSHLEHISRLRKEAAALRSLGDNISRKRSAEDDDEAAEKAEAKKRKKEEEEKRKKNMSVGLKKLAKADVSGMKKLSAFFGKKS